MNQRQILGHPLDNLRLRQSPGQHDFTMGPFSNNFPVIMNQSSGYARRASSINSNDVVQDWPDDNGWNHRPNIPFSSKRSGSPISGNQFNSAKRARIHQSANNSGRQGPQTPTFLGPQATYPNGNGNLDARSRSLTPAQQAFQRQQYNQVQHGSNASQSNSGHSLYVTRNIPQTYQRGFEIDRTRQDPQVFGQQSVPMQQISYAPLIEQPISRAPQQIQNPRNFPQERHKTPARGALPHYENSMEMQPPTGRQSLAKPLRPVQGALGQPSQVQRVQPPARQSTLEPLHPRASVNGGRNAGLRGQSMAPEPQGIVTHNQRASSFTPSFGQSNIHSQVFGSGLQYESIAPSHGQASNHSQVPGSNLRHESVTPPHGCNNNQSQVASSNLRYANVAPSSTQAQRPVKQNATRNRLSDYSLDVAMNRSHQALRPMESQGFWLSKSTSRSPPKQIPQRPSSAPQAAAVLEAPISQSFRNPIEKADNKPQNNCLASSVSNIPRGRVVNWRGPFIIDDDDDDFIRPDKSRNYQSGNNTNTAAAQQKIRPLTPPGRTAKMGADDELVTGQKATTDKQTKSASTQAKASLITPPSDSPSSSTLTPTTAPLFTRPTWKKIDFSKGRRGIRSLTHGLDDVPSQKSGGDTSSPQSSLESNSMGPPPSSTSKHAAEDLKAAEAKKRKQKSDERKVKKAEEKSMQDKLEKEAAALAKIKEKEEMAAKEKDADALFQEPVNEAAQARTEASKRREEQRKLETEIKKRHKQALAEELEQTKKEAAEKAKADKESEKAFKRAKSEEEREAIRQKRELEEAKRMMEQQRKAEELLAKKKHEQEQKDAAVREKEAEAEHKRQEVADKLRKTLEESKLAATSLKSARKRQEGEKSKDNENERVTKPDIDEPDFIEEDDGGLFVNESIDINLLEEINTATDGITRDDPEGNSRFQPTIPKYLSQNDPKMKSAAGPSSKDRGSDTPTSGKVFSAESLSLRARWKGAQKAAVESKAVGAVVQEHMERLEADQRKREDVAARERSREKSQEKKELAVLFEKLGSNMTAQVQKEIKTAVEKIAKERPPTIVAKERDTLNPFMGLASAQQKYSSEIQCSQKRPVGRPPKRSTKLDKQQEQTKKRREKADLRQAEAAKTRFEDKLHKDNAEQSRPMNAEEFVSMVERQMKEWWDRRQKSQQERPKLSTYLGGSTQSQGHFGYEDTDVHGSHPNTPSPATANVEKGRAGGIMARMRESNKSLGAFQAAAATKVVQDEKNYVDSDSESESEVSEEDPDEDDASMNPALKSQPISESPSQKNSSGIDGSKTSAEFTSTQEEFSDNDHDAAGQQPKPRHLQDMEMVYIFSVQRSERRNQLQSEPVVIKQFLDRDDANSFAEDELRRTRWGPLTHVAKITQSYSDTSGLFNGEAALDSEDELFECVNVVAIAQYTGNLDGFDHRKVKPIFKPKAFFIFCSITKLVPIPEASSDSDNPETSESEEPVGNKNEGSDEKENEKSGDLLVDELNALFDEEAKIAFEEDDDDTQANHGQQTIPQSEAHSSHGCKIMLEEKSKPLDVYTDRELANKRASEIFLDKIKPVGGNITLLVQYENNDVKETREFLENYNSSGELFQASKQLSNDGEEINVWVEDFLLRGPLN